MEFRNLFYAVKRVRSYERVLFWASRLHGGVCFSFFCMKTEEKKTELVKLREDGRERSSAKTEKEEEEVASLKESQ